MCGRARVDAGERRTMWVRCVPLAGATLHPARFLCVCMFPVPVGGAVRAGAIGRDAHADAPRTFAIVSRVKIRERPFSRRPSSPASKKLKHLGPHSCSSLARAFLGGLVRLAGPRFETLRLACATRREIARNPAVRSK